MSLPVNSARRTVIWTWDPRWELVCVEGQNSQLDPALEDRVWTPNNYTAVKWSSVKKKKKISWYKRIFYV